MFRPFEASSSQVQVDGRTVLAVISGMMIPGVGAALLAQEGLRDIQTDAWISQQAWLNVFRNISQRLGADTLYSVGYRIPYAAEFPSERMRDVPTALQSIDIAYHTAHRGGEIGCYEYSELDGGTHQIRCVNPYPCDFDLGIISSLVERFRGSQQYSVGHAPGGCRKRGDAHCCYHITRLPK